MTPEDRQHPVRDSGDEHAAREARLRDRESRRAGWIVGLVVSVVSILLAALLWSSRQL